MKALLLSDEDGFRQALQSVVQEVLEAEMTEAIGAEKGERTAERTSYRSGYYERKLVTRVGVLELRVPQDRAGRFSTELFERYQRSEKALVSALVEMYVQGVSTRKVKAVTEELCGHSFSASTVSEATMRLDEALKAFFTQRVEESYPYLILDARYERAREAGVIASQAVLVAIGVDWEGRRQVLGVELANRESHSSWREFVTGLKNRGLAGVEFVVSDDHPGLRAAIREVLPEAVWQRCYVHFLRNALDYVPRKVDDDCLMELRWFYDRRDLAEVKRDLAQWIAKWQAKYPKLVNWVEDNIEETLSFYRLPLAHHKHMKSTNMLERLNQEIKRRTLVVRIFPNPRSCLRLVRALAVEIHENWLEATRYLNMDHQREHKKESLRALAA
ncbi:transposase ISRM5 [Mesorhizobium sp. LNJC405B00]|nr:transposase ISRM5 [Mesorhizobium sp. LNJC405B00]